MRKKSSLGLRIRAHRLERRLTQEQLAEKIERSVEAVSNLERGRSLPNAATLHRLAAALDVSVEDLLLERSGRARTRPLEYYRATELLKQLDEKELRLALAVLKAIARH